MPQLISTPEGYEYWIPDAQEAEGNPLYQPHPQYNEDSKSFALPVDADDVSDLPTFKVNYNLGKPKDTRKKEEKLAEMFGVVPGPEGPLDIVKSLASGLTAPGEVAKGEVPQEDMLGRAIDTAGLGVTSPLAMRGGTATLGSGMTRKMNKIKQAIDRDGNALTDYNGKPILTDEDGKITLYHRTNEDSKNQIYKTGEFTSKENTNETFFADNLDSEYGKGFGEHVVTVKIDPKYVRLNDQFPSGENHYAVSNKFLNKSHLFSDSSQVGKALSIVQQAKPFFTNVENSLAKIPMKSGTAEQWINAFKRYGAGKEELEFAVGELPKGQITRAQIEQHLKDNAVQLNEVWKGSQKKTKEELIKENMNRGYTRQEAEETAIRQLEEGYMESMYPTTQTKYSQYQMPGGENYKELLLTTPHTPRDMVRPSDAASAKYLPEWQQNVAEINKLRAELEATPRGDKPYWRQATNARIHEIQNRQDVLHNQMVDDTIAASNGRLGGEAYRGSHWDEPNVIAHVRMNDRTIPGVGKTLHLEEIQSDWHQAGRKQGYKVPGKQIAEFEKRYDALNEELKYAQKYYEGRPDPDGLNGKVTGTSLLDAAKNAQNIIETDKSLTPKEIETFTRLMNGWKESYAKRYPQGEPKRSIKEIQKELGDLNDEWNKHHDALPNAPFKNNWDELALKKAIRVAVENGYDAISWTPGKHQSTNPSKLVDNIRYNLNKDGTYNIAALEKDTSNIQLEEKNISFKRLEELLGKELANKIKDDKGSIIDTGPFRGLKQLSNSDLELGGTKEFYDKILVDKANKLVKQFGGKVETKSVDVGNRYNSLAHFLDWAKEKDLMYSRHQLAQFWSEGAVNPLVKQFENSKKPQEVFTIKLTPELKKQALEKGFSLFSTTPIMVPIDYDPFERKDVKLVPIVGNPFGD